MGNGATAVSKMLWDENYLYVLTEVTDPVLSVASANAYEQDTVEVFFDENNHKTSSYESDDIQCRINYENDKTVTDGRSTDAFLSGTTKQVEKSTVLAVGLKDNAALKTDAATYGALKTIVNSSKAEKLQKLVSAVASRPRQASSAKRAPLRRPVRRP